VFCGLVGCEIILKFMVSYWEGLFFHYDKAVVSRANIDLERFICCLKVAFCKITGCVWLLWFCGLVWCFCGVVWWFFGFCCGVGVVWWLFGVVFFVSVLVWFVCFGVGWVFGVGWGCWGCVDVLVV